MEDHLQELEDLEALIDSPGWARFRAIADREWGAVAYRQKIQQLLQRVGAGEVENAAHLVMQLEVAAREVEKLFVFVEERIKFLRHGGAHAASTR